MRNDRIRIDPEFDPRPQEQQGRRTAWLVATALVVGAALVGLFMVVPSSPDGDDTIAVVASTSPTVAATSTSPSLAAAVASPPPATGPSPLATLGEPLSEAIPGFTDQVVMLATPDERFTVVRWAPSKSSTDVVLSMDRIAEYGCWPVGLDASGDWFARVQRDDTLIVHHVHDTPGESSRSEAIGLNVGSVAWHETEAGSVAWISCARSGSGPSTLYALNVADSTASPTSVRAFEQDCQDGIWLERWSDDGALISTTSDTEFEQILVDPDGATVDADSRRWASVPGLDDDAPVVDHAASPDGRFVAAIVDEHWDVEIPKLCVIDAESGALVTEVSEHGSDIVAMTWSTGGRFLIYELWNFEAESGGLEWYDTATNTTTRIPLTGIVDALRTANPG
ncbi:MAG: hypothetical protein WCC01_08080 [Acidimicrobiia bacterium]